MIDLPESPWVSSLTIIDGRPYANGDRLIAEFAASFAGLSVRGLQLVRTKAGGFRAISPAVSRIDGKEAIRFEDAAVGHAVMDAARTLYRQMGGKFGDYRGQQHRQEPR